MEWRCRLTPPSSGRSKGRFAPFGPPLMSNVRPRYATRLHSVAMKIRFPYTPTMRYERMLGAAVFSLVCFLLAVQLFTMSLQVAGELQQSSAAAAHRQNLRAVSFAFAGTSLGLVGCAFGTFAALKAAYFVRPIRMAVYFRLRRFGLGLVRSSVVFASLWLLSQFALGA